ncbi:MAG: hypothetical protein AAF555_01245 [Verrucomicrobiota bacterium]
MNKIGFLALALLWLSLPALVWGESRLLRDEEVILLEEFLPEGESVKLTLDEPAPIFYTRKAQRRLGTLEAPQEVELLAFDQFGFRIRGQATHGQVAGWIGQKTASGLSAEDVQNLAKLAERRKLVRELIANQEVALGMTPAECMEALGSPTRRASTLDAQGRSERLEWITYEKIPVYGYVTDPYTGAAYRQVIGYDKVETGFLSVAFENGAAAEIQEESEDTKDRGQLKIVPLPVEFPFRP